MIFRKHNKGSNSSLYTRVLSRFSLSQGYHNKTDHRRYLLLNASLLTFGVVLALFGLANIPKGHIVVAVAEFGMLLLC
ncbi:MAG: hypothetical protein JRE23_15975, partial [Deltaproteobacteria bacterium]|nr:hypothetical protein [Deltaproteobacteria bacterium]